jgi:hypothetical protein
MTRIDANIGNPGRRHDGGGRLDGQWREQPPTMWQGDLSAEYRAAARQPGTKPCRWSTRARRSFSRRPVIPCAARPANTLAVDSRATVTSATTTVDLTITPAKITPSTPSVEITGTINNL